MAKFRKKPVVIEAFHYSGDPYDVTGWAVQMGAETVWGVTESGISIPTFEGVMTASPGDWIIRGVKGEFYPCKPYIFDATYERVEDAGREDV